ncbi:MAG: hypothetical protein Q9213_004138 [Squamulea squamosa]
MNADVKIRPIQRKVESCQFWLSKKTRHGDLRNFMLHKERDLDMQERLRLCAEISEAIIIMHMNHIVHGDIKPENVLIFETKSGSYVAKVADFGYSTQYAETSDLIHMPRSKPWHAPEWHHRGFTPTQARQMDAFSFGMVVLWTLHYSMMDDSYLRLEGDLRGASNDVLTFARKLTQDVESPYKEILKVFYSKTLSEDAMEQYLQVAPHYLTTIFAVHFNSCTFDFQLLKDYLTHTEALKSMLQLYQFDFRVRKCVASGLFRRLLCFEDHQGTAHTPRNLLLECAFCYEVGFGVVRNQSHAKMLAEQCENYQNEIDQELTLAKDGIHRHPSFMGTYVALIEQGFSASSELSEGLRGQIRLERIKAEYYCEIKDAQNAVGPDHAIVLLLKSQLSSILSIHGRYDEAGLLREDVLKIRRSNLGPNNPRTLACMLDLAGIRRLQWRWDEAEQLQLQALVGQKPSPRDNIPPNLLLAMDSLAMICMEKGQWKKAETLQVALTQQMASTFGSNHPYTLAGLMNLADTYRSQGMWDEAEKIDSRAVQIDTVHHKEHPLTLRAIANQGATYRLKGQRKLASQVEAQCMRLAKVVLGEDHPDTLRSIVSVAIGYLEDGRWKEAEQLLTHVISDATIIRGKDHISTLVEINTLGVLYKSQHRYAEAEKVLSELLERTKPILGAGHPHTITCTHNLAVTYCEQGQWDKAEQLQLQITDRGACLGETPGTLTYLTNLAVTYYQQRRWKDAERLLSYAMEKGRMVVGDEHSVWLGIVAHLAETCIHQGRWQEAEELHDCVTETARRVSGEDHVDAVDGNLISS